MLECSLPSLSVRVARRARKLAVLPPRMRILLEPFQELQLSANAAVLPGTGAFGARLTSESAIIQLLMAMKLSRSAMTSG